MWLHGEGTSLPELAGGGARVGGTIMFSEPLTRVLVPGTAICLICASSLRKVLQSPGDVRGNEVHVDRVMSSLIVLTSAKLTTGECEAAMLADESLEGVSGLANEARAVVEGRFKSTNAPKGRLARWGKLGITVSERGREGVVGLHVEITCNEVERVTGLMWKSR